MRIKQRSVQGTQKERKPIIAAINRLRRDPKNKDALAFLSKALKGKFHYQLAAWLKTYSSSQRTMDKLLEALDTPNYRLTAIKTLQYSRFVQAKEVIPHLEKLLKDPDKLTRIYARRALEWIKRYNRFKR